MTFYSINNEVSLENDLLSFESLIGKDIGFDWEGYF